MTITFPLAVPAAFKAARVTIRANSVVGASASPFTAQQQTYVHQGQWWEAGVTVPPLDRDNGEEMVAWLTALNGREGTFALGDPAGAVPRGVATGTPVVDGAGQSGLTLAIRGATPSIANWLKAGDWLQLGTGASLRLHKVVAAASTDGTGAAVLDIWPRLRESPADGAAIVVSAAKGLWRLSANVREWDIRPPTIFDFTFAIREAL